jgi:hypothetical protein
MALDETRSSSGPHRFLNPDYGVFDFGGVALSEDRPNLDRESDRPILGGSPAKPGSNPFQRSAARRLLQKHAEMRRIRGWGAVCEQAFVVEHR